MTESHPGNLTKNPEQLKLSQQERLLRQVAALVDATMRESGINRKQLAEKLGVSKGRITQYLSGERNLTLRVVADIFTALDRSLELHISSAQRVPKEPS